MFSAFKIPISWYELAKRTFNEIMEDDVMGLSAQLAYYFFLALFPALLFLVAIASYIPVQDLMTQVTDALARFAPGEVLTIVRDQLKEIGGSKSGGLLTFGFLGTLWSTSAAMAGIMSTLNRAYEITESRSWWKVRLIAIGLTLAVGVFVLISFALVVVGPALAGPVADWLGLGQAFEITWKIAQWPIVFLLVASGIGLIYYFGPDAEQQWEWITPGSLVATLLWLISSLGFRYYVTSFGNFNATYGTIGGIIVVMLWLYITGMAILAGAEMNAEIEHASPWGKEKGEKRPGERKKIGRMAATAYEELRRRAGVGRSQGVPQLTPQPAAAFPGAAATATSASDPGRSPGSSGTPRRRAAGRAGFSDWLMGGAALAVQVAITVRALRRKVRG